MIGVLVGATVMIGSLVTTGFGGSIFQPPDADGNIFVQYSTGRYPGITVLRRTLTE